MKSLPTTPIVVCLVAEEASSSGTVPRWSIDSEAPLHMCHDKNIVAELREIASLSIKIGDDLHLHADKSMNCCKINVSESMQTSDLNDALYVLGFN